MVVDIYKLILNTGEVICEVEVSTRMYFITILAVKKH